MSSEVDFFSGGVAVITGAGSGIGEALARHAAKLGMKVVLADIAVERMEAVAAGIRAAGGEAMTVRTDVSDPASIEALAALTHASCGDVRLLVNNAGIEMIGFSWELPTASWEKLLDINIHGVIHGARAFAPRMLASGKRCIIANLSSVGGLSMMPLQTAYVLSKHAVLSFSECLSLEMQLKNSAVQVSAILPGAVATRIMSDAAMGSDAASEHHRSVMRDMTVQHGLSAMEAAERIFPQLAAGEFFVSTDAEFMRLMAQGRVQHLTALRRPELTAEMRAMCGFG